MEHLETTIRKIIKKGFDILNNRSNSTEREAQFHVVLPVLEELGYPKENFFVEKHCRVDKKDLYSDVYIEVDNGTGILVETKKAKKELKGISVLEDNGDLSEVAYDVLSLINE